MFKKKRKTYITKSVTDVIDHFIEKVTNEDVEVVIKIKLKKEEDK